MGRGRIRAETTYHDGGKQKDEMKSWKQSEKLLLAESDPLDPKQPSVLRLTNLKHSPPT